MHINSIQHGLKVCKWVIFIVTLDTKLQQVAFTFTIFIIFSASCFRIALVLFIKRLYEGTASRMRTVCDIFIWITIIFTAGACIGSSLQCLPVSTMLDVFEWTTASAKGTCNSIRGVRIISTLHVVLDCIVFLLPLRLVWQLKTLSLRRKIEVVAMFGCGLM